MNIENQILQVHLEDIIPNRFQPRLTFDEQGLKELADSIKEHGIIQPLVLRKLGDKFEIIAGERRYKAAGIAGLSTVPAVIAKLDDNASAEVALIENVQRKSLTPIEEARSYKNLLDRGYLTQDQLAKRMGLSQSAIANKLRLLNLDEKVQQALLEEKISERHARALLALTDKNQQVEWLNRVINERMTVRQLDIELKKVGGLTIEEDIEETPVVTNVDIDNIRRNAVDINNQDNRPSAASMMLPEDVMTEYSESLPTTNITSELEPIVQYNPLNTPDSTNLNNTNNKFFNLNVDYNNLDTEAETTELPAPPIEVFDNPLPTSQGGNDVMQPDNLITGEQPEKTIEPIPFNSENRFFTPATADLPKEKEAPVIPVIDPVNEISKLVEPSESSVSLQEINFGSAITEVRSLVNDLNNKGITVNIEEIDLEDKYQITIYIDK